MYPDFINYIKHNPELDFPDHRDLDLLGKVCGDTYCNAERRQAFMKLDHSHDEFLQPSYMHQAVFGEGHLAGVKLENTKLKGTKNVNAHLMGVLFKHEDMNGDTDGISYPEWSRVVMDDPEYWDTLLAYTKRLAQAQTDKTKPYEGCN